MAEYRLPFLEEDVAALYERIKVPHPIELNVRSNPTLAAVINDLLVPGSAFYFGVTPATPITASREGVVHTVRRGGLLSDAHATNLIVIEHEDGSAVRVEHLDPIYEKGDVVRTGDVIGLPKGYQGEPHIHWYSLQSSDRYFPNHPIRFSNVPQGKVNSEYQSIDHFFRDRFPELKLIEDLQSIPMRHHPIEVSPSDFYSIASPSEDQNSRHWIRVLDSLWKKPNSKP